MKWVRIAANIGSDPSVGNIADAIGVRRAHAVGLCTLVFAQMPEHARGGDLADVPDSTLESWAGWHGKRGAFAAAFRAQLCTPAGVVRAWEKHNGAAIRKADQDAERQRTHRDKRRVSPESRPAVTRDTPRDITRDAARDGTGRDVTTSRGAVDLGEGERRPHPDVENPAPPEPLPQDALRSPTVQRFLEHFYATAGEQRRVDVLRQLSQCLTAAGATLEGSERVRAADVDHLDEICSIVMHDPPNDPNLAIRFVLLKLRTTYTETLSARHRGAVPLRRVPSPASGPTRLNSMMAARA